MFLSGSVTPTVSDGDPTEPMNHVVCTDCSPPHALSISASNTRWQLECVFSFRFNLQLESISNLASVLLFFIALYSRQERILNLWRHCLRPSTTRVGSRSFGCVFEWFDHPYSFRWRPDGTDEPRFFMECSPPHAHFISASNTRWMLVCAVSFRLHLQLESILNHASPPVFFRLFI